MRSDWKAHLVLAPRQQLTPSLTLAGGGLLHCYAVLLRRRHGHAYQTRCTRNCARQHTILMQLLHRLTEKGVLPPEQAVALLGDAADELVSDPKQITDVRS